MTLSPTAFEKITDAWWGWVDQNCPHVAKRKRGQWMRSHTFKHDGTSWEMKTWTRLSNSRKSVVDRETEFRGADGRVIRKGFSRPVNRGSDPERNFGLGRD